ncbi:MAG: 4Fe-4S binding protein [Vulcanimicrobiota bacterium]
MKIARRIVQVIIFLIFLYLFFITVYPLQDKPSNIFNRISPLNSIMLAILDKFTPVFILGFILLGLTFILGRFFCGWICPMGTTIDLGEKCLGHSPNKKERKNLTWIKYIILILIISSAFSGVALGFWFEPTSLAYRFYTFSIFPIVNQAWVFLQQHIPALAYTELSFVDISYRFGIFYFLTFTGIFLLGHYQKRFWCRNLCPLGGLLGIGSRFSVNQRKVSSKCIDCGKCVADCKMGAIPEEPRDFKVTECIYCYNCVKVCPVNAISFKFEKPRSLEKLKESVINFFKGKKTPSPQTSSGFSRRNFLEGAVAGVVGASLVSTGYGEKHKYQRLIRPPGAMPEKDFDNACIRCGECMKTCITGGLQPTLLEAGIAGVMTPRLIPSAGHCERDCDMCQQACPTGAIQPFTLEDKPNIKIGTARINRNACIAWYRDEFCLVCDEHCPYKAVYWKKIDGRLRPFVDETKCVGCGFCENKCPVNPESAIQVFSQGEKRVMKKDNTWQQINPIPENTEADKHQVQPPPPDDGFGYP